MGIKGIYAEIGSGKRIALSKLAAQHLQSLGRPFRLAIDVSIWQFQNQSGQGGRNPAARTLYYRLLRLMSLCIQPLFVFDGPHKPPFKRSKNTARYRNPATREPLTKRLFDLFGFPYVIAPGEAEAECALLQRRGIVDAVLSEDIDTLMFGATQTIRNWSGEDSRGNKSPTHVNLYEACELQESHTGISPQGMILVALMSGGDYSPAGIPGCGVKTACEAARAGFGDDLCRIRANDSQALTRWRERLIHELRTNESKFFRTRHASLQIPDLFPDREILRYYTHPLTSTEAQVDELRHTIHWTRSPDISALRKFVADEFEWTKELGSQKFIRGMNPVLLVHQLQNSAEAFYQKGQNSDSDSANFPITIHSVCGQRNHFTTDGLSEFRLLYEPILFMETDSQQVPPSEEPFTSSLAVEEDHEARFEPFPSTQDVESVHDTCGPQKIWVIESIVRAAMPALIETWDAERERLSAEAASAVIKSQGASKRMTRKPESTMVGALDAYFHLTKPVTFIQHIISEENSSSQSSKLVSGGKKTSVLRTNEPRTPTSRRTRKPREIDKANTMLSPPSERLRNVSTNPWTLSRRLAEQHEAPQYARGSLTRVSLELDSTHAEDNCVDLTSSSPIAPSDPHSSLPSASPRRSAVQTQDCEMKSLKPSWTSSNKTAHVLVRQSLEGAWKSLMDNESGQSWKSGALSNVPVLDMTQE